MGAVMGLKQNDTVLARGTANFRLGRHPGTLILDWTGALMFVTDHDVNGVNRYDQFDFSSFKALTAKVSTVETESEETAVAVIDALDTFKEKVFSVLSREMNSGTRERILRDLGLLRTYDVTLREIRRVQATSLANAKRLALSGRNTNTGVLSAREVER